jgi:hypothetical protein
MYFGLHEKSTVSQVRSPHCPNEKQVQLIRVHGRLFEKPYVTKLEDKRARYLPACDFR